MVAILVAFFVAQALFGSFVAVLIRGERRQRFASASVANTRLRQYKFGSVVGTWARPCCEHLRSMLASARLVSEERARPYALPAPYDCRRLHERRGSPGALPAKVPWPKAA
jgi:hypothetical protein